MTFKIYHWDTFDNAISFVKKARSVKEATDYIMSHYNVHERGADRMDVVDEDGNIVKQFPIR